MVSADSSVSPHHPSMDRSLAVRFFSISEILGHVIEYLHDYKRTLASLSCVCKAFTEPALDALWKTLPSFDPFVILLPKDLIQQRGDPQSQIIVCLIVSESHEIGTDGVFRSLSHAQLWQATSINSYSTLPGSDISRSTRVG